MEKARQIRSNVKVLVTVFSIAPAMLVSEFLGQKKAIIMPHHWRLWILIVYRKIYQFQVWATKLVNAQCIECSKMQLFEPMCESSNCRGEEWSVFGDWFSWFLRRQLANKWLCTTQNWLFCVVLVVRLLHSQFFQKKTGDHLLGSALCARNFCWIWLILKHSYSRLLFTFGLIRVNPFDRSSAIVFLKHFFRPINTSLLLSDWKIVWDPTRTNYFFFLTAKYSCIIECMLFPLMPINLKIGHMMILQYQLAHSINGFRNNNWFWTTFTKFVLVWTTTSVVCTIPSIKFVLVHRCTVVELIDVESCKK